MQIKSFVATMGLGMAAGAAAILMFPKNSKVYQAADDTAHMIKSEAIKFTNKLSKNNNS